MNIKIIDTYSLCKSVLILCVVSLLLVEHTLQVRINPILGTLLCVAIPTLVLLWACRVNAYRRLCVGNRLIRDTVTIQYQILAVSAGATVEYIGQLQRHYDTYYVDIAGKSTLTFQSDGIIHAFGNTNIVVDAVYITVLDQHIDDVVNRNIELRRCPRV